MWAVEVQCNSGGLTISEITRIPKLSWPQPSALSISTSFAPSADTLTSPRLSIDTLLGVPPPRCRKGFEHYSDGGCAVLLVYTVRIFYVHHSTLCPRVKCCLFVSCTVMGAAFNLTVGRRFSAARPVRRAETRFSRVMPIV